MSGALKAGLVAGGLLAALVIYPRLDLGGAPSKVPYGEEELAPLRAVGDAFFAAIRKKNYQTAFDLLSDETQAQYGDLEDFKQNWNSFHQIYGGISAIRLDEAWHYSGRSWAFLEYKIKPMPSADSYPFEENVQLQIQPVKDGWKITSWHDFYQESATKK